MAKQRAEEEAREAQEVEELEADLASKETRSRRAGLRRPARLGNRESRLLKLALGHETSGCPLVRGTRITRRGGEGQVRALDGAGCGDTRAVPRAVRLLPVFNTTGTLLQTPCLWQLLFGVSLPSEGVQEFGGLLDGENSMEQLFLLVFGNKRGTDYESGTDTVYQKGEKFVG